ncbi:MAG: hypothetical protein HY898_32330 [Deltaproteobacteria bacterium]|nr:hypothetical protein [Deltaproteobacteria bacterium]
MRRAALSSMFAAVAAVAFGVGCAQERAPINRVQADALQKSFFVGAVGDPADDPEFYMRTTVVDAQAGAGSDGLFTSSDAEPTMRVRFEITEKTLFARLTYELVDNTDFKGARRTPDGQVVAAYEITKHFDIRRDYNASTGEELNVVTENDTDRPWYQRDYFRVNWSKNLVADTYDFDTLSQLGIYYGVKFEPIAYYVNDPTSPDVPVFDEKTGYFDVTNKVYAAPQIIHDAEWGDFPACWLVGRFPTESCNPAEITLRHSFLKVVDHDYEPLDFDGTRMDMFGWFTMDRYGYDRRYGVVDDKWHRFATRWNIYEQSHADPMVRCATPETTPVGANVHRDDNADGTEDECASVGRGSRCDAFRGECTLPMRDRKIKTIAWHVNQGFPEELFEGTALALDGWSEAIRVATIAARLAECRRTGEAGCEAQMGWPQPWTDNYSPPVGTSAPNEVPKIFVLCHNPVDALKDDTAVCGPEGTTARLGDLRFNLMNVIQSPQITAPWGIMMDAEDPLTGEKIAGSVNQWGAVLDRAASTLVDILGLINGTVDPDKYLQGKNVTDWIKANQPGGSAQRSKPMGAAEIASRKAALDPAVIENYLAGIHGGSGGPHTKVPPSMRHKQRVDALTAGGRLGPGNTALSARLTQLHGSPTEAAMVSPELAQLVGYNPKGPITKDAIQRGSPFGRLNPAVRRSNEISARVAHARRHSCRIEDTEPDNLLGMAQEAAKLFAAPDPKDPKAVLDYQQKVYLWARQEYSKGVMAHEMGHSMGLRHNFAATFDSLNYHTPYWQLRTKNGEVVGECPEGTTDGTDCIGPRWRDPISQYEIDGNIGRYSTSSVMDYPGDQNHDQMLQGKYDRAAMRFGYGGVVDMWAEEGVSVNGAGGGQEKAYKLTAFTANPGLFGLYYFPQVDPSAAYLRIHYSRYNGEFGLLGACQADTSPGSVLGQKCASSPMDVVDYRDLIDFASDPEYASFSWGVNTKAVDAKGRVRRGYLFSSDEYADTGNVPSFTYDAGADPYEQIRFLEAGYENRYIVDSFRHNRVQFNSWDTTARIQSHYLDTIQLIAKTFAFGAVLDGDPTQPTTEFLDDGYYGPLAMGSTVALDLYARILTRPEPGYYCPADVCATTGQPYGVDLPVHVADWAPQPDKYLYDFRVTLGDGKYVHNDFDYSQGYWWADYQTQVGVYYEKIWATYYLTEAFDFFISNSKEDFTDSRYKNVNFATVYPEQIRRLYANLFTGDLEAFSPWTEPPADPSDTPTEPLRYPTWYDRTGLGTRGATAKLADPNFAFNERLYAMVWGAMFFPTNWSNSWINDARIAVLANDEPGWPASEVYAFYNPANGLTYKAHAVGTEKLFGKDHQKGVGARMIEWANRLAAIAYLVDEDPLGNPLTNTNGTLQYTLDGNGKAQLNTANAGAAAVLQKYVDDLDTFRQLTATFIRPLDDSSLPQP